MANVKLSTAELELVTNIPVILTKNRIINAVQEIFGELSTAYQSCIEKTHGLPDNVKAISPKIYKGENYEGLPWVMLDYPRYFTRTDELAIRSYFWWGNYFSITLQVSGEFISQFAEGIVRLAKVQSDWQLMTHEDKWHHIISNSNSTPLQGVQAAQLLQMPFIKVVKTHPLQQWDMAPAFFTASFETLVKIVFG
ncbi:hypothetical protein [Hydrotalea sandarakina]|jgi:hypothetical protein|uniref:Uncharacterized protein n=1 Tax=Hydrotalea sandarakina TaxID=1004304 RepID=A0A2W7RJ72_9BACT|nr:hypothetical protein [Hydrotalea sandarakina]PZX60908.1 hypothetical protein LX80_02392 [Hydrotalea sandarakina]